MQAAPLASILAWTTGLLLAGFSSLNLAAQFVVWQGFEIHYTTFSSRLIPADVAALHGIKRADNRVVTNIALRLEGKPVRARLQGHVTNLLNQQSGLVFTEVVERDAIYYLSNQLVDERDTLKYVIEIYPEGLTSPYQLEFIRDFYQ